MFLDYDNVHSLDPDSQNHQLSLWVVKGRMCQVPVIVRCSHDYGVCLFHPFESMAALRRKQDQTKLIPKFPKLDSVCRVAGSLKRSSSSSRATSPLTNSLTLIICVCSYCMSIIDILTHYITFNVFLFESCDCKPRDSCDIPLRQQ